MVRLAGKRFGLDEPAFTEQLQSTTEQAWLQSGDGPHFGTQSNLRPQPTELGSGYANATSFLNDGNREYDVPKGMEKVQGQNPYPFMGDNDFLGSDPGVLSDASPSVVPQDGAPLPEVVDGIQKREQELMRRRHQYLMNPENHPAPYHPGKNPVLPDYPFGRPTGTGGWT